MSAHSSLPTPRQFLTSLLNSPPATTQDPGHLSSNPLKAIPPEERYLLTTLHVLFPTPILLPALDLLDRQLVTRVVQSTLPEPRKADWVEVHPPQAHIHLRPEAEPTERQPSNWRKGNYFYVVTSASDVRGRGGGGGAVGGRQSYGGVSQGQRQTYIVRTRAWNCSCAAFTFGAFPGAMDGFHMDSELGDEDTMGIRMDMDVRDIESENDWEFGGVASDGRNSGNVPCCKHLLACILAEKWEAVFGQYVVQKKAEREEMAGLGAGIG